MPSDRAAFSEFFLKFFMGVLPSKSLSGILKEKGGFPMHPHIHRTPQSRPPLPGLTSAARGYWQSIGNAGVACQILGWALCRFPAGEQGSIYGLLFSILGICAFLAELYGRLRYRKKQLSFPRGYSLCRYLGFCLLDGAVALQYRPLDEWSAVLLLGGGLLFVWMSLGIEKRQRRRLREQREMEET